MVEACSWVDPRRYLYTLVWPGRTDKIQEDGKFADDLALVTATVRPLDLTCPFHFVALCPQVSESRMSRAKLGAMVKEMRKYDPQFSSNYTYICTDAEVELESCQAAGVTCAENWQASMHCLKF